MLDGAVLLDTVMTHALVGALVGIVEMLLVAPFAVPPLERFSIAWRPAPPLTICDANGVQTAGVHVRDAAQWSSHAWVFEPLHCFNTPRTIRAHVVFVARVCARVDVSAFVVVFFSNSCDPHVELSRSLSL